VGINLGMLGFLTQIEKDKIAYYVNKILSNDFFIQKRSMLNVTMMHDDNVLFNEDILNDVVVSKRSSSKSIGISCYVNDSILNNYLADGIIISTPTGSTAYSFSAGGPIVDPMANVTILTPVCAHSTYARPYITTNENTVKIMPDFGTERGIIAIDGIEPCHVLTNDIILVKKSNLHSKFITFSQDKCFKKIIN